VAKGEMKLINVMLNHIAVL